MIRHIHLASYSGRGDRKKQTINKRRYWGNSIGEDITKNKSGVIDFRRKKIPRKRGEKKKKEPQGGSGSQ